MSEENPGKFQKAQKHKHTYSKSFPCQDQILSSTLFQGQLSGFQQRSHHPFSLPIVSWERIGHDRVNLHDCGHSFGKVICTVQTQRVQWNVIFILGMWQCIIRLIINRPLMMPVPLDAGWPNTSCLSFSARLHSIFQSSLRPPMDITTNW